MESCVNIAVKVQITLSLLSDTLTTPLLCGEVQNTAYVTVTVLSHNTEMKEASVLM